MPPREWPSSPSRERSTLPSSGSANRVRAPAFASASSVNVASTSWRKRRSSLFGISPQPPSTRRSRPGAIATNPCAASAFTSERKPRSLRCSRFQQGHESPSPMTGQLSPWAPCASRTTGCGPAVVGAAIVPQSRIGMFESRPSAAAAAGRGGHRGRSPSRRCSAVRTTVCWCRPGSREARASRASSGCRTERRARAPARAAVRAGRWASASMSSPSVRTGGHVRLRSSWRAHERRGRGAGVSAEDREPRRVDGEPLAREAVDRAVRAQRGERAVHGRDERAALRERRCRTARRS